MLVAQPAVAGAGIRAGYLGFDYAALVLDEGIHAPPRTRPDRVADRYPNARWRKFVHNLKVSSRRRHRALLCKWFARAWAEAHPQRPLSAVRIYYNKETVAGDGTITPAGRTMLWRYTVK